jgi:hypothetical protein
MQLYNEMFSEKVKYNLSTKPETLLPIFRIIPQIWTELVFKRLHDNEKRLIQ